MFDSGAACQEELGPLSPVSMGNLPSCLALPVMRISFTITLADASSSKRTSVTVTHTRKSALRQNLGAWKESDVSGLSVSRKQTQPSSRRGKSVIAVLPATATLNNHLPSFSDIDFDINTTTTTTHTAHCHSYIAGPTAHTILEGSLTGRADGGNPSQAGHCW